MMMMRAFVASALAVQAVSILQFRKAEPELPEGFMREELVLLAGAADARDNVTVEWMTRHGWTHGPVVQEHTQQHQDHVTAWRDNSGRCVAVFTATNEAKDYAEIIMGVENMQTLCDFKVHGGVAQQMFGLVSSPEVQPLKDFLTSSSCKSVTAAGFSYGGAIATVFAGCANSRKMSNMIPRSDWSLVTFGAFAPSLQPIYNGIAGQKFAGARYAVTQGDKSGLPDNTKDFRSDLLQIYARLANATGNDQGARFLRQAYQQMKTLPQGQVETAWALVEPKLKPMLFPSFGLATNPPAGLQQLQQDYFEMLNRMKNRGDLSFNYDIVPALFNIVDYKHPLVDFQPLRQPVRDSGGAALPKVSASLEASGLPKADPWQGLCAFMESGTFQNHRICCYSSLSQSDCTNSFIAQWAAYKTCEN